LHNLITFEDDEFEGVLWKVLQTGPFQRLRRVKQLGFSEFVYPGATHSRFAHSVGVFHTARMLMKRVERFAGSAFKETKAKQALAAALVHDVGHGAFSHAFEDVGKKLKLKMANHELVSDRIIKESEVSEVLNELGAGFSSDVADIIGERGKPSIYSAVVSSQFDADRLDYMRRDRMMTGSQHGAIDFNWLIDNLEVGKVGYGTDEEFVGDVETFVLSNKAQMAAEAYVLGLFHLYPAVYFHKTTRGVEKIFTELLLRIFNLVGDGSVPSTGLTCGHPIVKFAKDPDGLDRALDLDDTVIWGALPLLSEAKDPSISKLAARLRYRVLYKAIDIRSEVLKTIGGMDSLEIGERIDRISKSIQSRVDEISNQERDDTPRYLQDTAKRSPYKKFDESKGPLNLINIKSSTGELVDLSKLSQAVAAIEPHRLHRVYTQEDDYAGVKELRRIIEEEVANDT
jgi:hypothetical protein